jgi:predicted enzyme related to lactoylglutathione lyase
MKRVTGIGGIFFKSQNPDKTKAWYKTHLGLDTDDYGSSFKWLETQAPHKPGMTQWSPFRASTKYFEPSKKDFMINYRVDDLVALVEQLKKEGVRILDEIDDNEFGKFVHILDDEDNSVELWEAPEGM